MLSFGINPRKKRITVWPEFCRSVRALGLVLMNLNPGTQGKAVLLSLISDYKSEYEQLTEEDKEEIVQLYKESKAVECTAKRLNGSSQVNTVTATLTAIETEVFLPAGLIFSYSFFLSSWEILDLAPELRPFSM
jgi:hypothetical protein